MSPRTPHSLPPVMPFRWACAYGEDRIGLWQAFEVAGVRQVMRWIPPGEFLMGSPETEAGRSDDERQHRVVLTEGFWMADTACTQALWVAVMGANPRRFTDDPQNPVVHVSWNDITQEFLPRLNRLVPGLNLTLPTEAQWEYACRAGTTTAYEFGDSFDPTRANADSGRISKVRDFPPNGWGLYQMHGNVSEWCADKRRTYFEDNVIDPDGGQEDTERALRGGAWFVDVTGARSAHRAVGWQGDHSNLVGFRFALRSID